MAITTQPNRPIRRQQQQQTMAPPPPRPPRAGQPYQAANPITPQAPSTVPSMERDTPRPVGSGIGQAITQSQPSVPPPTVTPPTVTPPTTNAAPRLQGTSYAGRDYANTNVDGVQIGSEQYGQMTPAQQRQMVLTAEARRRQQALDSGFGSYFNGIAQQEYDRYRSDPTNGSAAGVGQYLDFNTWRANNEDPYRQAWIRDNGFPEGDPSDPSLTDADLLDEFGRTGAHQSEPDTTGYIVGQEGDPALAVDPLLDSEDDPLDWADPSDETGGDGRAPDWLQQDVTGNTPLTDGGPFIWGGSGDNPLTGIPPRGGFERTPPARGPATSTLDEPDPIDRPDFDVDFETADPMDIFNQGADALEARLERGRQDSTRRISEEMARRGTLDGSPEWGALTDLESELNVQRQEGLSQLSREQQQFALQNRAQELQKYGIDSELSYSYAALEQDSGFRQQAMELQARGMDMDEAYRYAAMSQDARFRQIALDLQRRGMDMDEAYRQAALQWEKERFGSEMGLQRGNQQLDRDRFRAWIQQMLYQNQIEEDDVPPWLLELMNG